MGRSPIPGVSLHMLEQSALELVYAGKYLAEIEGVAENVQHAIVGRVPKNLLPNLKGRLEFIRDRCVSFGLEMSVKGANRILELPAQDWKLRSLKPMFAELERLIEHELEDVLLLQIPHSKAKYYEDVPQFGKSVVEEFPDAEPDIQEAAKCLATMRYTACVFHLMRVTERAVQHLGKRLGVILADEKNWHNILDQVERAIKALPAKSSTEKTQRNRYSEACAHLRMVKDAWRNSVMHPKETYTEEEAERIFRNVKDFMVHLASKL